MQSHTKENESYHNGPWCYHGADPDIQWYDSPQRYGTGRIYDILDSHTVSKDTITANNIQLPLYSNCTLNYRKHFKSCKKVCQEFSSTSSSKVQLGRYILVPYNCVFPDY